MSEGMSDDPDVQAAIAARVLQARDELLSLLSHDLRGPLNAITVALDGLRDPGAGPEAREKYVAAIQRSVVRADRIIHDQLTVHEIDAGTLQLQPAPVAVRALFEQLERDSQQALTSARTRLVLVIDAGAEAVFADRDRIAQALGHLVTNACRHARGTPTIELTSRPAAGGGVVLGVRDQGPGVSAEVLPHLFDRDWPGHKRRGGVGLAIARGVARAHGGDARAAVGGGLEVTVELPAGAP